MKLRRTDNDYRPFEPDSEWSESMERAWKTLAWVTCFFYAAITALVLFVAWKIWG